MCIMMNPLTGQRGLSCSIPGPATVSPTPIYPDPLPCILAALRASQRHDLSGGGERVLLAFPVSLWRVLWLLLRDLGLSYPSPVPVSCLSLACPAVPLLPLCGASVLHPVPASPLHPFTVCGDPMGPGLASLAGRGDWLRVALFSLEYNMRGYYSHLNIM